MLFTDQITVGVDDVGVEEHRIRLNALFAWLIRCGGAGAEGSWLRASWRDAECADALVGDHAPNCICAVAELHAESAGEPLHGEWRLVHAPLRVPGAELRFDIRNREEGARDALWRGAEIDGLVAHYVADAFVVEGLVDAATVRRCRVQPDAC